LKPHATTQAAGIIKDTATGPKVSSFSQIAEQLTDSAQLLETGV
jgi:hypothetical protein